MAKAQILSQRPFNQVDGSRFLVVANIKNIPQVFNRSYKGKPIFTKNLYDAKTYKDYSVLEKVLYMFEGYNYVVYQVKDLFESRYLVKHVKKEMFIEPRIDCKPVWSLMTAPVANTFTDYAEAQEALNKYKCRLLEYYHQKMMDITKLYIHKMERD
jgi:hypothetical protein